MTQPTALIIGAGLIGASTALELARRGWRVTVLERAAEPGQGSTASSTAIIRQLYHERHSIALAVEGLRYWESWPAPLGGGAGPTARFVPCGVLWVFPRTELDAQPLETLRGLGAEIELLTGAALRQRFPAHDFDGAGLELAGLLETRGGFVDDPALAVRNLADAARAAGAEIRCAETVVAATFDDGALARGGRRRITGVTTASGRHLAADVVINAAGPQSARVNLILGTPLPLQTAPNLQNFFDAREEALPWDALPRTAFPVCADTVAGLYFKPDPARFRAGAVLADDDRIFVEDADAPAPAAAPGFVADKRERLARRLPGAALQEIVPGGAYYDVTVADWSPIFDRTDVDGVFVGIGTSGKWFKSGPVLGWILAELIEHVRAGHDPDDPEDRLVVRLPRSGNTLALSDFARWRNPHRTQGVLA